MNTTEIQTLLHHRPPYLLVDEVIEISSQNITAIRTANENDFFIKGHFPGAPVVPGAMIQEMCTQSAGILITKFYSPVNNYNSDKTKGHALGVLSKVYSAKYNGFIRANKVITIKIELTDHLSDAFRFKAQVFQDNEKRASLQFRLVNISDEHLFE